MPRSKVGKALTRVRGPVHGNFAEGATITQGVLALVQGGSSWPRMSAAKREAVHMIVHKIHRIVTGNPDHKDHWDDIGGYAQLGANDCVDAVPIKKRKARVVVSVPKLRPWKAPAAVKRAKAKVAKVVRRALARPTRASDAATPAQRKKMRAKKVVVRPAKKRAAVRPAPVAAAPRQRRPRATEAASLVGGHE
jgi:hypothetical protein